MILYNDSLLNVDDKLKEHLIHQSFEKYDIEKILDDRYSEENQEVLVQWKGFDEPSWEPESIIREDVPEMLEQYFQSKN
jgi:hypothetical protein